MREKGSAPRKAKGRTRRRRGRLHLIAGIPGTDVQGILRRLRQHAEAQGFPIAEHISLEEKLREIAQPDLDSVGAPHTLMAVFKLPQEHLRRRWAEAWRSCIKEANEATSSGKDAIVTLHLNYFHHKYREFVVAADFELIRKTIGGELKRIVTLIDDVYDVHTRLCRGGQVFLAPGDAERAFIDATRVLNWRAGELRVASNLAAALGIPHYVCAAKHPLSTLFGLLLTAKPTVYFSHPISEVRRLRAVGNRAGADHLLGEIRSFVDQLSQDFVVFEPTTIDELRFDGSSARRGNLGERWPFVQDDRELCWDAPQSLPEADRRFAFPVGWEFDTRNDIATVPVVEDFRGAIGQQIGARDHWLVEQSDFLVCHRPICDGHQSSGVMHELLDVQTLAVLDVKRRPRHAFVLSPREDREKFPLRSLYGDVLPSLAAVLKPNQADVPDSRQNIERLCDHVRDHGAADPQVLGTLAGEADAFQRLIGRFSLHVRPLDEQGVLDDSEVSRRDDHAEQVVKSILARTTTTYLEKLRESGVLDVFDNREDLLLSLRSMTNQLGDKYAKKRQKPGQQQPKHRSPAKTAPRRIPR